MNEYLLYAFYAVLTVVLAFLGYNFGNAILNVSANVGAVIGAVLGVAISVGLFYTVGKAWIDKSS